MTTTLHHRRLTPHHHLFTTARLSAARFSRLQATKTKTTPKLHSHFYGNILTKHTFTSTNLKAESKTNTQHCLTRQRCYITQLPTMLRKSTYVERHFLPTMTFRPTQLPPSTKEVPTFSINHPGLQCTRHYTNINNYLDSSLTSISCMDSPTDVILLTMTVILLSLLRLRGWYKGDPCLPS